MLDIKTLVPDAGWDIPSSIDRDYNDIIPADYGGDVSDAITLENIKKHIKIFNQGGTNACGWFGMWHTINAERIVQDLDRGKNNQQDPMPKWNSYQDERPEISRGRGTSLQLNLKYFVEKGYISGYALCKDIETSKRSINNNHFIYTGANNIDWTNVRIKKIAKLTKPNLTTGHIICGAIGYDDTGFIAINSYGQNNGIFHIPYDIWMSIYSKYSIFGKDDTDLIAKYRKMGQFEKELKTAISNGITDGTRQNETATRAETAVMVQRGIEKVTQKLTELVNTRFSEMADLINSKK